MLTQQASSQLHLEYAMQRAAGATLSQRSNFVKTNDTCSVRKKG
jgi:hypothetical protein